MFSPCGMVMDWLTGSVYKRQCNVVIGGNPVNLIWYPAAPGAQVFPFPHAFTSLTWLQDNQVADPTSAGEIPGAPKIWMPSTQRPSPGLCFRGLPDWFSTGVPQSALSGPVYECPSCVGESAYVTLRYGLGGAYSSAWSPAFDQVQI